MISGNALSVDATGHEYWFRYGSIVKSACWCWLWGGEMATDRTVVFFRDGEITVEPFGYALGAMGWCL